MLNSYLTLLCSAHHSKLVWRADLYQNSWCADWIFSIAMCGSPKTIYARTSWSWYFFSFWPSWNLLNQINIFELPPSISWWQSSNVEHHWIFKNAVSFEIARSVRSFVALSLRPSWPLLNKILSAFLRWHFPNEVSFKQCWTVYPHNVIMEESITFPVV